MADNYVPSQVVPIVEGVIVNEHPELVDAGSKPLLDEKGRELFDSKGRILFAE